MPWTVTEAAALKPALINSHSGHDSWGSGEKASHFGWRLRVSPNLNPNLNISPNPNPSVIPKPNPNPKPDPNQARAFFRHALQVTLGLATT